MPEDKSVEWQAAQWVARRMGDQPFDRGGFDAWIAEDPNHQPVFDTMWQRIMGPGMDDALRRVADQRNARRRMLAGGAAAAAVLLFGGYQALPAIELSMAKPRHYAAAEGGLRDVVLDDGSRLTLAGGAEVRVRYTRHVRAVELVQGTLFADVAPDKALPFRVDAGDSRVTVVGTRFEVSAKPASTRVTVESGVVRFGPGGWFGTPIELTADQAAVTDSSGVHRIARAAGVARWRSGWVEYRDAPLREVIGDLESLSPQPIEIAGERLAGLKVSGRIRLNDPMRQLDNLAVIHDFAVTRRNGVIVLSGR